MSNDNTSDLQQFRLGFCEKAAELGICPSDLLAHVKQANTKQALNIPGLSAITGTAWDTIKQVPWYGAAALMGGGAVLGGLTAYGANELSNSIDPDGSILGEEDDPVSEAKKLQLIAKYQNAIDQINALKNDKR
jgi:uncharacterized membrane protein